MNLPSVHIVLTRVRKFKFSKIILTADSSDLYTVQKEIKINSKMSDQLKSLNKMAGSRNYEKEYESRGCQRSLNSLLDVSCFPNIQESFSNRATRHKSLEFFFMVLGQSASDTH